MSFGVVPQQSPLPNLVAFTRGSSLVRKKRVLESAKSNKLPPQTPLKMSATRSSSSVIQPKTVAKTVKTDLFKPIQPLRISENESEDMHFKLEWILGSGSFGIVYKVQSLHDNLFYALKQSKQCFRTNSERKLALQNAAVYNHIMNSKNSEYCVSLLDVWEESNKIYYLMELCDFGTLRIYLNLNPPIAENVIWHFLNNIANALRALKDSELVHLDIKPENLFFCKDGKLKLGDFGNCRFYKPPESKLKFRASLSDNLMTTDNLESREHQTSPCILAGTGSYLAPELVRQSHFDYGVDMFSLGVILFEMAADVDIPFRDEGWMQLRSLNGEDPLMNDETKMLYETRSLELRALIARLLHSNPLSRATLEDIYAEKLFKESYLFVPENLSQVDVLPVSGLDIEESPNLEESPDIVTSDPKLSRNLFDSDFQEQENENINKNLALELSLI